MSLLQMDSPSYDIYRLSSLLHSLSEPSPRTVIFMTVLSRGGVSPSYRLCMYYFLSIYFLSLISELCYHLNHNIKITKFKSIIFKGSIIIIIMTAGLQGYISYHHIAAVWMFDLVVLLLIGHMQGSTGAHHLRSCLCFSSCVRHVWFV